MERGMAAEEEEGNDGEDAADASGSGEDGEMCGTGAATPSTTSSISSSPSTSSIPGEDGPSAPSLSLIDGAIDPGLLLPLLAASFSAVVNAVTLDLLLSPGRVALRIDGAREAGSSTSSTASMSGSRETRERPSADSERGSSTTDGSGSSSGRSISTSASRLAYCGRKKVSKAGEDKEEKGRTVRHRGQQNPG